MMDGWDHDEPGLDIDALCKENAKLRGRVEELERVLADARRAIISLPQDDLGHDPTDGYPYQDELIVRIDTVLLGLNRET